MSDPRFFVISGPSGVGKSTLIAAAKRDPRVHLAVSATTRTPRPGEVDGVHYHFVTQEMFDRMRDSNEFLEWARVHDQCYGTPRSELSRTGAEVVLLDIDIQGFQSMRDLRIPVIGVFISPPNLQELEKRLRNRKTENEASIARRLKAAAAEIAAADRYDHVLINRNLKEAESEFLQLLGLSPGNVPSTQRKGVSP